MRDVITRVWAWLRRLVGLEAIPPVESGVPEPAVVDVPTAETVEQDNGEQQVDDEQADDVMLSVFNLGFEAGWDARKADDDQRRELRVEAEKDGLLLALSSYAERRPAGRPVV